MLLGQPPRTERACCECNSHNAGELCGWASGSEQPEATTKSCTEQRQWQQHQAVQGSRHRWGGGLLQSGFAHPLQKMWRVPVVGQGVRQAARPVAKLAMAAAERSPGFQATDFHQQRLEGPVHGIPASGFKVTLNISLRLMVKGRKCFGVQRRLHPAGQFMVWCTRLVGPKPQLRRSKEVRWKICAFGAQKTA